MSATQMLLVLVCVFAISIGQILFKKVGVEVQSAGTWFHFNALLFLFIAGVTYVGATVLWIHVLRTVELSRAYPYMALSFVLVPFWGWWVLGESVSITYLVGAAMIVLGLVVLNI